MGPGHRRLRPLAFVVAFVAWVGTCGAEDAIRRTIEDILAQDVRELSAACGQVEFHSVPESQLHPPNGDGPTPVDVSTFVLGIDTIDAVTGSFRFEGFMSLVWCDPRTAFDPVATGEDLRFFGLESRLDLEGRLWWPEVFLPTRIGSAEASGQYVVTYPDGTVHLALKINTRMSARFDYNDFPLDRQTMVIPLQSHTYRADGVELRAPLDRSGFDTEFEIPEWTVVASDARVVERPVADGGPPFLRYQGEIVIERKYGYYVWKVLIPILIIMCVSWSVFWMSRDVLAQRQRQASTALLTIVAFQFVAAGFLPRVPYLTLMDTIILWSFCVIAMALPLNVRNIRGMREDAAVGLRRDRLWRKLYPAIYGAGLALIFLWHFLRN